MRENENLKVLEVLTLRFDGENKDGAPLHELKAEHVADVLEGLTELAQDFEKAGAFHMEGIEESELLVRPAKEGSFIMEVIRVAQENPEATKETLTFLGLPSLGSIIWWAKKKFTVGVENFEELENSNYKVYWTDGTASELSALTWNELQKRQPARRRQLRKIMAPLEDGRVKDAEVTAASNASTVETESFELDKNDFQAVKPLDEETTKSTTFKVDARMATVDFEKEKWKVKTQDKTKSAIIEDEYFLKKVKEGLPISSEDLFTLTVREDKITKEEKTRTTWTVLNVAWEEEPDNDGSTEKEATTDN